MIKFGFHIMGTKVTEVKNHFFFFKHVVSGLQTIKVICDLDVGPGHLANTEFLSFSPGNSPFLTVRCSVEPSCTVHIWSGCCM